MPNFLRWQQIKETLQPYNATLVAVSKMQPVSEIKALYDAGQRVFGENKAQELLEKQSLLPTDIQWHFIGHLQTNKVKQIAPFVSLIHSIDSWKLLQETDRQARLCKRQIRVLLQVHIAQEAHKYGWKPAQLCELLDDQRALQNFPNIVVCGLMGMASFTNNRQQIAHEFEGLRHFFEQLRDTYFANSSHFTECSMGMSGDYDLALSTGSTMLRIGTALFSTET